MKHFLMAVIAVVAISATGYAAPSELDVQQHDKKDLFIVKFGASWCAPCQQMNRHSWTDKKVKEQVKQYKNGKVYTIDADEDKKWIRMYNITKLPTIIIMDSKGNSLKRHVGYLTAKQLKEFLSATPHKTTVGTVPKEEVSVFGAVTVLKWVIIGLAKFALFILT